MDCREVYRHIDRDDFVVWLTRLPDSDFGMLLVGLERMGLGPALGAVQAVAAIRMSGVYQST